MLVSLGLEEHEEVFTRLSSLFFFSMKIIQPAALHPIGHRLQGEARPGEASSACVRDFVWGSLTIYSSDSEQIVKDSQRENSNVAL